MIVWPDEVQLRSEAREALRRFRDTSACAELESQARPWRVVAWPWTCEPPLRLIFEDDDYNALAFTLGEAGTWLFTEEPRATHLRSAAALECDARADMSDACQAPHLPAPT
jgi:hypothetical protein